MNPQEPQNPGVMPSPNQPAQPPVQSMDFVQPPPETPASIEQPIQMPPYAPAQPPVSPEASASEPNFAAPVMPVPITSATHKTDTLGIVSIVLALFGVFPVGLTLGLVGASKAKKTGRSVKLSRIGWILNLISLVVVSVLAFLVLGNFQDAQVKARDVERATDLAAIEVALEEYFAANFGYPSSLNKLDITNNKILIGPKGSTIKVNDIAADEDEAKATANPTSSVEYTYTPYGKPTCLTTCDGYVLKSLIEAPTTVTTNPLVKLGLKNL